VSILLYPSDADVARLGCKPVLPLDLHSVTAREAATLQRPIWPGSDGELIPFERPQAWREALRGTPMFDSTGAPVMVKVKETLPDGSVETTEEQKRAPHYGAHLAMLWLALRRSGIEVDPATLDYDQDTLRWAWETATEPDAEPEAGPGKGDGVEEPATTSSD
jgi:hypothetical protein